MAILVSAATVAVGYVSSDLVSSSSSLSASLLSLFYVNNTDTNDLVRWWLVKRRIAGGFNCLQVFCLDGKSFRSFTSAELFS